MDPLGCGLVAFRHAPVPLSGVCYGRLDVAAELSAEAAVAAIERGLADLRVRPRAVWSSPLSRCAAPAAALAARLGAPHAVDERLLEIAYGAWEGRAWSDIERDDPIAYAAWLRGWERVGPPGGESAIEVEARVRSFWRALAVTFGTSVDLGTPGASSAPGATSGSSSSAPGATSGSSSAPGATSGSSSAPGASVPPGSSSAGPHVLVAHAGVLRALRVVACGATWPEAMSAPAPHLAPERFPLPGSAVSLAAP
ncbi:histidine phosphatase family protein [Sorangium sp. So ce315]|uniref:histidine phosphatase family protein n=1 Tax=Sorangium sp. So ce315 TaxID=3133299 RepID=UPI003F615BEB